MSGVWHHKAINRLDTEKLLLGSAKDGSFLIRDSESVANAFVLSLIYQGHIHHYRIFREKDGRFYMQAVPGVENQHFELLEHIVTYYSQPDRGLPCQLKYPVICHSCDDYDSDDEEDEEEYPEEIVDEANNDKSAAARDTIKYQMSQVKSEGVDQHFLDAVGYYSGEPLLIDLRTATNGGQTLEGLQKLLANSSQDLVKELKLLVARLAFLQNVFSYNNKDNTRTLVSYDFAVGNIHNSKIVRVCLSVLAHTNEIFIHAICGRGTDVCITYRAFSITFLTTNIYAVCLVMELLASLLFIHRLPFVLAFTSAVLVVRKKPLPGLGTFPLSMHRVVIHKSGQTTRTAKALKSLQDIAKLQDVSNANQEQEKRIQSRKFEVVDKSASFKGKTYLLVDYIGGKISFLKNQSESAEPSNTVNHSKILQLIKSRTNIKRLGMKLDSKPVKEFEFDDGKSREVFCQLVQQVKNQDSKNSTIEQISVFVGTWNLGDANPPENLGTWFKCQGHGATRDTDVAHFAHDIYAIGTQECSLSESNWLPKIKTELRELFHIDFKCVGTCTLWGIRLVILVKPDHQNLISHVQQSSVKTGLANALGNKGAVGISFMFSATSLCFINCHLAARSTRVSRRNQNYHDILKGLNLGQKSVFDLTNQFNHVFWFGDLNYRIDMEVNDVLESIKANNLYKMRKADQLWNEIKKGNVFCGFKEDTINFSPTYRHRRGGKDYVWEKAKRSGILVNVPSWCDRVLCHSFPETKIMNTSYAKSSKHTDKEECRIVFNDIEATIKTNSKSQFIIEFYSSCLESMEKSKQNSIRRAGSVYGQGKIMHAYPSWGSQVLPTLYPIIPDRNYLEDQHLLLAIKSVDNDESYGECCISLKAMIADTHQKFEAKLTHSGEETGEIRYTSHTCSVKERDPAPLPKSRPLSHPKVDSVPPPLPAKTFNRPQSVMELLRQIGFPQFHDILIENGFDEVNFLKEITEVDLKDTAVPEHIRKKVW
ncbi:hypothetical protein QZH41_013014 [Actinostola sp. cb2023]|nr:hypothetical protein QZH41_013014 [Actinostola sp. cb2023]